MLAGCLAFRVFNAPKKLHQFGSLTVTKKSSASSTGTGFYVLIKSSP